jgi:hypothetical protein
VPGRFDRPPQAGFDRKERDRRGDVEAVRAALQEEEAGAKDRAAALKQAHAEWSGEITALRELL